MTAIQMGALNAEILQNLGVIAEDESVLTRVAKYLRRVVKEMTDDPTAMTKEEFLEMVDKANQGPLYEMRPDEDLTTFLKRLEHEV